MGAVCFCQRSPRGSTAHWTEDSLFLALLSAQWHLTVVLPLVLQSDPAFFPVPLSVFYGTSRPAPHTSQQARAARESLLGQRPRSFISKFLFVFNSSAWPCGSHGAVWNDLSSFFDFTNATSPGHPSACLQLYVSGLVASLLFLTVF